MEVETVYVGKRGTLVAVRNEQSRRESEISAQIDGEETVVH
jgi:hypothetical protein